MVKMIKQVKDYPSLIEEYLQKGKEIEAFNWIAEAQAGELRTLAANHLEKYFLDIARDRLQNPGLGNGQIKYFLLAAKCHFFATGERADSYFGEIQRIPIAPIFDLESMIRITINAMRQEGFKL